MLVRCFSAIPVYPLFHKLAKTFTDLSYGNEPVPVSCINGLDGLYPDYVEYSTHRHPGEDVKLNLDPNFLVCCDCTDMCQDSSKCACRRLTIVATGALDKDSNYDETAGCVFFFSSNASLLTCLSGRIYDEKIFFSS